MWIQGLLQQNGGEAEAPEEAAAPAPEASAQNFKMDPENADWRGQTREAAYQYGAERAVEDFEKAAAAKEAGYFFGGGYKEAMMQLQKQAFGEAPGEQHSTTMADVQRKRKGSIIFAEPGERNERINKQIATKEPGLLSLQGIKNRGSAAGSRVADAAKAVHGRLGTLGTVGAGVGGAAALAGAGYGVHKLLQHRKAKKAAAEAAKQAGVANDPAVMMAIEVLQSKGLI